MDRTVLGLGCAVALLLGGSSAHAQGTVKIGLINVLSGQFADAGIQNARVLEKRLRQSCGHGLDRVGADHNGALWTCP